MHFKIIQIIFIYLNYFIYWVSNLFLFFFSTPVWKPLCLDKADQFFDVVNASITTSDLTSQTLKLWKLWLASFLVLLANLSSYSITMITNHFQALDEWVCVLVFNRALRYLCFSGLTLTFHRCLLWVIVIATVERWGNVIAGSWLRPPHVQTNKY